MDVDHSGGESYAQKKIMGSIGKQYSFSHETTGEHFIAIFCTVTQLG